MAAWCYLWRNANGWTSDREREIVEVRRLARCVAELGKDDAVSLAFGGLALAYVAGDLEDGEALIKRALVLNPNLHGGMVRQWLGEGFSGRDRYRYRARGPGDAVEPA